MSSSVRRETGGMHVKKEPVTDRLTRRRAREPSKSGRTGRWGARPKGAPPGVKGNPALVVTAEMRQRVKVLATVFPVHSQHHIAAILGISKSSLHKHFSDELRLGRGELIAAIGARMIDIALNGPDPSKPKADVRAEIQAMKFFLVRYGGW